jgi:putative sigma-54 modulation protein
MDVDEEEDLEVVRTKTVVLKPETVEEAILQMNLIGHMFYMFRNAETDNVCVVYRRNDGGYGLIEPDFE